MKVNVRAALTLILALLGVFAIDGAEAGRRRGGGYHRPRRCGARGYKCCRQGYRGPRYCWQKWTRCLSKGYRSKCVPCGGLYQYQCEKGDPCRGKLVADHVKGKDICVRPPCGGEAHQPCCRWAYCNPKKDLYCNRHEKECQKCGGHGEACCPGYRRKACKAGNVCHKGHCESCGAPGQKCCKGYGGCNDGSKCSKGHCVEITCNKHGDHCCPGHKCEGYLNCAKRRGKCQKCGHKGGHCCKHGPQCNNTGVTKEHDKLACVHTPHGDFCKRKRY